MPFTAAHPAIILPFIRLRNFSATALILGSVAPDFEYFFKMSFGSAHSHTVAGLFYFNLPVTLLLAIVFHQVVKHHLIRNLPVVFQCRFQDTLQLEFLPYLKKNWIVFTISALLGAGSHLLWDSFTHGDGYFAEEISEFKEILVNVNGTEYPLYFVLQYGSSALGMLLILIYVLAKPKEIIPYPVIIKPSYWLTVILVATSIGVLRFVIWPDDYRIWNLIITVIGASCWALTLVGLFKRKPHSA